MIEFIADVAGNHNGDLNRSRHLIREAARIGCAGIKFPLFRTETIFAPQVLKVSAKHRLLRRLELPLCFVPKLSQYARELGLKFGITPFDLDTVDAVQTEVDFFAPSAYELPWLDLIDRCADTGLPLLIETDMADASETWNAIQTALEAGCTDLTMLRGTALYPAPEESCNLASIGTMREVLVREFAPVYEDADLKAGWSDNSVSAGVIARAVNHWGCDVIAFNLDLEGSGDQFGDGHCWLPDRIGDVIAGGYLPVRRDSDGTGRIAPDPSELEHRDWRAHPDDGLRPTVSLRKSWPLSQPEATRKGPDVYMLVDGAATRCYDRCLALAESLRDDHDADVIFLVRGTAPPEGRLERNGFNWTRYPYIEQVAGQIAFLDNLTSHDGPAVCIVDTSEPIDRLTAELQGNGMLTVVIDQPACQNMNLGVINSFGWQHPGDRSNLVGGTEHLLIRDDVVFLRSRQQTAGVPTSFPRVVVSYGGTDRHGLTTRTTSSLHDILPHAVVQVVLNPAANQHNLVGQILASRFPAYEIITTGDDLAPIIADADVLITDPGTTIHEALCLGVPGLVLANYPSEAEAVARLSASGAVVDLGFHDGVTDAELSQALQTVFNDPDRLSRLRYQAQELANGPVDGHGASRVADHICRLVKNRDGTTG